MSRDTQDGGSRDDAAASPEEWRARRERLDRRLEMHRVRAAERDPAGRSGGMQGMAQGLRIASEFIAGILVGAAIGYGIDRLFGTGPFGLIVFLMIGFAAGVLNVVRSASKTATAAGDDAAPRGPGG